MKKEKERNLTLEQLEKKRDFLATIALMNVVVMVFVVIICLPTSLIVVNDKKIIFVYLILGVLLFGLSYFCLTLNDEYKDRINEIKKQKVADEIKQLGKNGNIKDSVSIVDPEIRMNILARSFRKIEIEDYLNKEFLAKIQFKGNEGANDFSLNTTISREVFLSLLSEEQKEEMIEKLIDSVEVETINDENGERTKIQIAIGKEFLYTNPHATDDELLQMLKLKK